MRTSRKRAAAPRRPASSDDLRDHYDFDYSKARSNRFAGHLSQESVIVVLEPDVANVFHTSEAVNAFLRSAIAAMPQADQGKRKRAS
jgi:hypothetical protein